MSCGISSRFQLLSPSEGQVAHVLLTRPPLTWGASSPRPFDLHVLGTPPAFVLSQDQTLKKWYLKSFRTQNLCESESQLHSNSLRCDVSIAPVSWCVRLALHCLIYKVHSLPGLPRSVPRFGFPQRRACLIYHLPFCLSTPIFLFFQVFSYAPSEALSRGLFPGLRAAKNRPVFTTARFFRC